MNQDQNKETEETLLWQENEFHAVRLYQIGESATDIRFSIERDRAYAGGITAYKGENGTFSYGIAIVREKRRQGIATEALHLLFREMSERGYRKAAIRIKADNDASLGLHKKLGFAEDGCQKDGPTQVVCMECSMPSFAVKDKV